MAISTNWFGVAFIFSNSCVYVDSPLGNLTRSGGWGVVVQ